MQQQPKPTRVDEPTIIINGVQLNVGQAMTLRNAITCFLHDMGKSGALGEDEMGIALAKGYADRSYEILKIMAFGEI